MVTTIQVQDSTLAILKSVRKLHSARSYDELIRKLLGKTEPKSMAGVLGKKMTWDKIMDGLRDENDDE